jgi:hypothetical protein
VEHHLHNILLEVKVLPEGKILFVLFILVFALNICYAFLKGRKLFLCCFSNIKLVFMKGLYVVVLLKLAPGKCTVARFVLVEAICC